MMFNNLNLRISPKASIGKNVRIGDDTVIFDNVVIEDNVTITHNCIIGEPLNSYYSDPEYGNPPTVIGRGSLIRSHAIIYAGNRLGEQVSTGHRVTLRENNIIGDHSVIGTLSDLQGNVIIGKYCRLYSNVHIAALSVLGDFVALYPYVVMTNDPYPPSDDLKGGTIGDYTQVGTHSTILAGVMIGHNCLIGALSVVSKTVSDYSLVMGEPAKVIMDVRNYVALGKGHLYPWMNRFSRGTPWDGIGYDAWMKAKGRKKR
ncbi:MAG TPA: N-acetyltransferase [Bacteroidales bacterium]|nr:N-acetyltransferase [Bacteroidales bacterium]